MRNKILIAAVLLVGVASVAYAALSQTLTINGTGTAETIPAPATPSRTAPRLTFLQYRFNPCNTITFIITEGGACML